LLGSDVDRQGSMHMSAYTTTGVFNGTLLKKGGGFSVGGRRNWKVGAGVRTGRWGGGGGWTKPQSHTRNVYAHAHRHSVRCASINA
jgi:hypothetical protein